MSENPPTNMPPEGSDNRPDSGSNGGPDSGPYSTAHTPPERSASMQLRAQAAGTDRANRSLLDPANQSLTDALKISFRVLQLAMVVLVVLFLASGVKTVQENERGIQLLFGKPTNTSVEPGGHFSPPHPFGEMLTIDTGAITVALDRPFFVRVSTQNPDYAVDRLPRPTRLDPTQHGSLITADGALAHTRWQIVYRRRDPVAYARSVNPETERELVLAAVRHAVVHAVSHVTIDELLKQSSGEEGSVAQVAHRLAQRSLDELDCGISIENLYLVDKIPPTTLIEDFNAVAEAESQAGQRREVAEQARRTTLNGVAGPAAGAIVEAIEDYDRAIVSGDEAEQEDALNRVFALLGGEIEDQPQVSGEVSRIIELATVDADETARRAESQYELFRAKVEQFRANPSLMITRDWNEARNAFLAHERVQIMRVPDLTTRTLELVINQDPDIVRSIEQAAKMRQQSEALRDREDRLREAHRQPAGR